MSGKKTTIEKIVSAVGSTMFLSIIIKVIGFIKQGTIAAIYGSTYETDVFFMASEFINNISLALFSSLGIVIVPTYLKKKETDQSEKNYVSKILTIFGVLSIFIVLIFEFGSGIIAPILAPGYSTIQKDMLISELRIMAPAIAFISVVYIFKAVLDAEKDFLPSKSIGGIQSIILIFLSVVFAKKYGVTSLSIGFTLAAIVEVFFLLFFVKKYYSYTKVTKLFDSEVLDLIKKMLPLCIGSSIADLSVIIDKIIATELGEGMVSALAYGQTLKSFVVAVIMSTTISVLFVYLASYVAKNELKKTIDLIDNALSVLTLLLMPISIISFVCAEEIIELIYGRGSFDEIAVKNTAIVLRGYAIGFIPLGIRSILMKVHYAFGDSKRPMINGTIAVIVNIILSLGLGYRIGVLGIVIATSVSYLVSAVLMLITVRVHIDNYYPRRLWNTLRKSILPIIMCVIIAVVLQNKIECGVFIKLIITTLSVMLGYVVVLKICGVSEITYVYNIIKKKIGRG